MATGGSKSKKEKSDRKIFNLSLHSTKDKEMIKFLEDKSFTKIAKEHIQNMMEAQELGDKFAEENQFNVPPGKVLIDQERLIELAMAAGKASQTISAPAPVAQPQEPVMIPKESEVTEQPKELTEAPEAPEEKPKKPQQELSPKLQELSQNVTMGIGRNRRNRTEKDDSEN